MYTSIAVCIYIIIHEESDWIFYSSRDTFNKKTNALQVAPAPISPIPPLQKSVQQMCIPGKDDHLPSAQFQGTWPHPFVQRSHAFLTED